MPTYMICNLVNSVITMKNKAIIILLVYYIHSVDVSPV
jgi:hypothetical protein